MNKVLGAIALSIILTACGGGGNSSPIPQPTQKPQNSVAFTFASSSHSQSNVRTTQSGPTCGGNGSTRGVMAYGSFNPPANASYYWYLADATATEYNAACAVVSSTPAMAASTVAQTVVPAVAKAVGTPAAGHAFVSGANAGLGTVTATFPDNTTANVPVAAYAQLGVTCNSNVYLAPNTVAATNAWTPSGPVTTPTNGCGNSNTPASSGDIETDPSCVPGSSNCTSNIVIPGGYDIVTTASGGASIDSLPTITNCNAFTSQGTALPSNTQTPFVLLFKTSDGKCVKADVIALSTNGLSQQYPTLVAFYAVSDGTGAFSY